jgi:hypothetical protein
VFYVEALRSAAAATEAFIVTSGGRPPEVGDAVKTVGGAPSDYHYRLSLSGEAPIEMIVRLLNE